MAYIGNTVQNQGFAPAIDYFNGNGVTVTFTLSRPVASVAQLIVAIDNVIQNPSSSFTVAGNAITFTSAPLSGTNNIWVEYTSLITTYQGISQDPTVIGDIRATGGYLAEGDFGNSFVDGTVVDYVTGRGRVTVGELDDITLYHGGTGARSPMMDLYYAGGAKIYGTTALTIPVGTTAERPISPATGMIRQNTTTGNPEWYSTATSSWIPFGDTAGSLYSVDYLVVAGGGGGAGGAANGNGTGGGGAGGFRTASITLTSTTAYTVTIGAGGSPGQNNQVGGNGANSVFGSITSTGGGGGATPSTSTGASGGSGGGGAVNGAGGAGTSGQGNAGGQGSASVDPYRGGGGGGASAVGAGGTASGNGGAGSASTFSGASVTYAGGGGGGAFTGYSGGSGGAGGGGAGSGGAVDGVSGSANTGGGAGAGGWSSSSWGAGGTGGSGIVIIRYAGAQRGTGGTVTTVGGFTIHTFTSSGTYTA